MGTQLSLTQKGAQRLPNFRPISVVAKRLDGSRCHLHGMEVGIGLGDFVLHGDPALPLPKKGAEPSPIFGPCLL